MQIPPGSAIELEARRDVDAVAENVAILDNDVAQVEPDAIEQGARRRHVAVSSRHPLLKIDRAPERLRDALEFHQHAVAGRLDNAALAFGDRRVDQLEPHRLQSSESSLLIDFHKSGVADDIGRKNRSEAALYFLTFHRANDLFQEYEL